MFHATRVVVPNAPSRTACRWAPPCLRADLGASRIAPNLTATPSCAPHRAGIGTILDPSSDKDDLPAGTVLRMPLWMVLAMAPRGAIEVRMPSFFGSKMRRKLRAGAACEDLRHRCPHFYRVAILLHEAMILSGDMDEQFPAFLLSTLQARYKVRGVGALRGGTATVVMESSRQAWPRRLEARGKFSSATALPDVEREDGSEPSEMLASAMLHPRSPFSDQSSLPCCPPPLQDLLMRGHTVENNVEVTKIQMKLSVEEQTLFDEALESARAYERWRSGDSLQTPKAKTTGFKRKWSEDQENQAPN